MDTSKLIPPDGVEMEAPYCHPGMAYAEHFDDMQPVPEATGSVEREGSGAIHNPTPKLGSGERFKAVERKAAASGARNPAAVAAAAGIKKYGQKKMTAMAQAGKRRKAGK